MSINRDFDGGETDQTITVTATPDLEIFFSSGPTVTYSSADTTASIAYTVAPNMSGNATVTVTVSDDGGTDNDGLDSVSKSFIVSVTGINDAPSISNLDGTTAAFTEDGGAVSITSGASDTVTVADIDNTSFDGGTLTLGLSDVESTDLLAISESGSFLSITAGSPNELYYDHDSDASTDAVLVATYSDFSQGSDWVFSLTSNATATAVGDLLNAITYNNSSDTPDTTDRSLTVVLVDGKGTDNGGADTSDTSTVTISVTETNDATNHFWSRWWYFDSNRRG